MLQIALDFLKACGVWGLYGATAIEASSLPFPGALFVLLYGYLLDAGPIEMVMIGFVNSVIFSIFSLIPFMIGTRLSNYSRKKFDTIKIEKAQGWFRRYGAWSIVLTRPLSIGNYVSYISGMSGISPLRFFVFTWLGAFPWNTFLLFVGNSGSLEHIEHFLATLQSFGTYTIIILVLILLAWFFIWKWRQGKIKAKIDPDQL